MHMHATPCDGMCQKALIRKVCFVHQCRCDAGRTTIFACQDRTLVVFL